MDGSSQLKASNGESGDNLPCTSTEGTCARTRPFSFEEVMLRRKDKDAVAELEASPKLFDELDAKGETIENQERSYSSDEPEPKSASEDLVGGSYRRQESRKEDALSDRNREYSRSHRKTRHEAEIDYDMKRSNEKSTGGRHAKDIGSDYHKRESDQYEDEYEYEYKKARKDVSSRVVNMERGRRSERDIRSQPIVNSVRLKSEIDKSGLRKQDIRHVHDIEYSEKRGRRYEGPRQDIRHMQDDEYYDRRGRRYEEPRRDFRQMQNFEYFENRGRRYEEPKFRKRRSRSREYDRRNERSVSMSPRTRRLSSRRSPVSPRAQKPNKRRSPQASPRERRHNRRSHSGSPRVRKRSDRRSASASPRPQKNHHPESIRHENGGESLPHSFKEKSGKESSETDRLKTTGDGVSTRRHGSGLGEYSPRKKKTEAVTKTPSPVRHSPDRKAATWDQPPTSSIATNLLSTIKTNESSSSMPIVAVPVIPHVSPPLSTPILPMEISVDSIHLTQATRPKRRLYIENLPNSASDKAVIEWLNDFLRCSGISRFHGKSPCISCIINKEKCQAVVEFLTPEDATVALSLDGKSFSGSILKIRRPKDFVDASTAIPEKAPDKAETRYVVSDHVEDSPQKVFIGGISKALTSSMLMEIVRSFGALKAYQFDVAESGEPYVFLEYADPGVTLNACSGLNGMKLGGQVLTVVRAFSGLNLDEGHMEGLPCEDVPTHAKPLLMNPTKVLKLKNIFNLEEFMLLQDPELEEILEDVRIECARFGTVKSINAVQVNENSTNGSEQSPHPVHMETGTIVGQSETESKSLTYEITETEKPSMEGSLPNPIMDCENRENGTGNPFEDVMETSSPNQEVKESSLPDVLEVDAPPENMQIPVATEAEDCGGINDAPASEEQMLGSMETEDPTPGILVEATDKGKPSECKEENLSPDALLLEPGCVLVEFMREEAACIAAHYLNGRVYDGRIVEVSYITQDVYLEQFPR